MLYEGKNLVKVPLRKEKGWRALKPGVELGKTRSPTWQPGVGLGHRASGGTPTHISQDTNVTRKEARQPLDARGRAIGHPDGANTPTLSRQAINDSLTLSTGG